MNFLQNSSHPFALGSSLHLYEGSGLKQSLCLGYSSQNFGQPGLIGTAVHPSGSGSSKHLSLGGYSHIELLQMKLKHYSALSQVDPADYLSLQTLFLSQYSNMHSSSLVQAAFNFFTHQYWHLPLSDFSQNKAHCRPS